MTHEKMTHFKMPEMKLSKSASNKFLRFGLQNLGMMIGFSIMLLLSVFVVPIR